MKNYKVFRGCINGKDTIFGAFTSLSKFAEATGVSYGYVKKYVAEVANESLMEKALKNPETILIEGK